MRKGLRWIPRHLEMRKGVVSDKMLWGIENKYKSRDSQIGQPFKLLLDPWVDKRQPRFFRINFSRVFECFFKVKEINVYFVKENNFIFICYFEMCKMFFFFNKKIWRSYIFCKFE